MPTTNKRINLTVPAHIYERIESYKAKNGISSDAAACLQLIVRQLDSMDNADKMMQMVLRFSPEELQLITKLGIQQLNQLKDNNAE